MIELLGLTKRFGDLVAVAGLSFEVRPGEIFGFLGPNGAGKTTTVKMLSGLLQPTSGTARIAGFDIVRQPLEAKRCLGLIPDEPFVYPKLTGAEFLRLVGDLHGVDEALQRRKVPELLEMFELRSWGGELVEAYSHGMRQKLVLAGILLHEPKALLLDEPLVGLDPKSARLAKEIFRALASRGCAIFMCTHVLDIAEKICDRVGIMIEGKLLALGTIEEMRSKAGDGKAALEDVFLSLTGGTEYASLLRYL
ncbi:MAG: ABC transporter ATP-binding protein [Elusimicrobia bacterium]|nr:ABC transporter ATP-binding protein [Elusimicrobiota bacterium]